MMELGCAVFLAIFSMCSPLIAPGAGAGQPQMMRVSDSTDLLGRQIAVAPGGLWGDARRLAFCGPDGIVRFGEGGRPQPPVPTDSVRELAEASGRPLSPHLAAAPVCQSVVLDPREPDTFYAVFSSVRPPQDAPPPWFAAGYVTRDAGQSWQAVPPPPDAVDVRFTGFTVEGAVVQALYDRPPAGPRAADAGAEVAPPLVMATGDGGRTWAAAPFACPANGPCIRWGAPPTGLGSCAMHGYGQPLLVSSDGGQTWRSPAGAWAANGCKPNTLVAVSDRDVLLLAPGADDLDGNAAPIRISRDGGRTFTPATLPSGVDPRDIFELYLLPDQRLLAHVSGPTPGPGWSWQLLAPNDSRADDVPNGSRADSGSNGWCVASWPALPTSGSPLRVTSDRLWWRAPDAPDGVGSVTVANVACREQASAPPPIDEP